MVAARKEAAKSIRQDRAMASVGQGGR